MTRIESKLWTLRDGFRRIFPTDFVFICTENTLIHYISIIEIIKFNLTVIREHFHLPFHTHIYFLATPDAPMFGADVWLVLFEQLFHFSYYFPVVHFRRIRAMVIKHSRPTRHEYYIFYSKMVCSRMPL